MKALAFLALAIHWFNPLVWVAFILASKDMEMSCDEAVIRKIGGDVRADYSASLLTLATGRRIIAGTPLAFGEGDTKGRINNLSKWKKPAVWVVLVAVVACVVLAVCLLTNPSQTRDTMKWAQSLSVEDVASADLVVYPQAADKQFKQLSAEELSEMVALINESKGKYRIEHEELAGGGISFYITMKDGTSHSVENIGNTYLVIDGEYYEASYNWLNGWSKRFGEGNTRIPDQYFSVPLTLDEVLELSQRGHELIWGDFNSCYEMTFFNRKSQRTFTCQIVQNTKRHLKRAKTMQISGIGHSVIRGLVTTGQWFSASTTVYPRGSPQGRRHSYFVDC